VVKAFQGVDLVTTKGQSIFLYLYMTTLGVPTIVSVILPVGLLMGVSSCISSMNNDSELVVINASGASQSVIIRPLMALCLLVAIAVMTIALYLGPTSLSLLRSFVTQVRSDLVSVIIKEGKFNKIGKKITFHISARAPGGILKDVFVLDEREKDETFTYLAREGVIIKEKKSSFILLKQGEIQRATRNNPNISIIKFDSYVFDLSSFSGGKGKGTSLEEMSTISLIFPNKNSWYYKKRPGALRAETHNRLTAGLYPFAFILIVLAISGRARSTRQGYAMGVTLAFIMCVSLRGASIVVLNGSRNNPDSFFLIYALPLVGIVIPSIYLFLGKQISLPKFVQHGLDGVQIWVGNLYRKLRQRYLLFRRNSQEVT
jgi:lipopolysaccharide export system permease protein